MYPPAPEPKEIPLENALAKVLEKHGATYQQAFDAVQELIIDAEKAHAAPAPVMIPDAEFEDIEGAILALPDVPELDEAVQSPIQHPAIKPFQSVKPAGTVSELKQMQLDWADISNPAVGRITIKASNVSSGVVTAQGRYDLELAGVTTAMMNKLRELLSCR
jgi:hypothetical protein